MVLSDDETVLMRSEIDSDVVLSGDEVVLMRSEIDTVMWS